MKPLNSFDYETVEEIKIRQFKLQSKIALADEMLKANQIGQAGSLYREAKNLSLYVGKGLKVRVINEDADFQQWHELNKKINDLS